MHSIELIPIINNIRKYTNKLWIPPNYISYEEYKNKNNLYQKCYIHRYTNKNINIKTHVHVNELISILNIEYDIAKYFKLELDDQQKSIITTWISAYVYVHDLAIVTILSEKYDNHVSDSMMTLSFIKNKISNKIKKILNFNYKYIKICDSTLANNVYWVNYNVREYVIDEAIDLALRQYHKYGTFEKLGPTKIRILSLTSIGVNNFFANLKDLDFVKNIIIQINELRNVDKIIIRHCMDNDSFVIYAQDPKILMQKQEKRLIVANNSSKFAFKIVAIDPGITNFCTCISTSEIFIIGRNLAKSLDENLMLLNSLNLDTTHFRDKLVQLQLEKINNIMLDLYNSAIEYLTSIYNIILIGGNDLETDALMYNDTNDLLILNDTNNTYKMESIVNFKKFRHMLKQKCLALNIICIDIDESYTTRLCSSCGDFLAQRSKRKYKCKLCNINWDRDVNACRNIFLKFYLMINFSVF